jgi:hypothetical protein
MISPEEFKKLQQSVENGKVSELLEGYYDLVGVEAGNKFVQSFNIALASYDPEKALSAKIKRVGAEIDTILDNGATSTETDKRALESYTEYLLEATEELSNYSNEFEKLDKKKIAAKLAVDLTKFTKGVQKLNEALEDSEDVLKNWEDGSIETWEAVA